MHLENIIHSVVTKRSIRSWRLETETGGLDINFYIAFKSDICTECLCECGSRYFLNGLIIFRYKFVNM